MVITQGQMAAGKYRRYALAEYWPHQRDTGIPKILKSHRTRKYAGLCGRFLHLLNRYRMPSKAIYRTQSLKRLFNICRTGESMPLQKCGLGPLHKATCFTEKPFKLFDLMCINQTVGDSL